MAAMFTYMRQTPGISSAPADTMKHLKHGSTPPPTGAWVPWIQMTSEQCLSMPVRPSKWVLALFRPSGEVLFAYMNFIETWIKKKTKKYAELPTIHVSSKMWKHKMYPSPLLEKNTQLGFEPGASRCWNPTPSCHAEENVVFMVISF